MEYIVYSISNHICAGNAETSINTGLRLCSSSITSDWKIEFDFTTQTISAAQQSYIRCRHETSPYPGVGLRSNTANGPTQIQINSSSTTVATGNNKRCTGSITRSGNTITVVFNGTTFSKAFTNHESPLTFGGELENSAAGTWKSGRFSSIVINSIRIIQYASYSVPMEAFMWSRRMAMTYTDKYIVFADPVVEQICATNWGDGVGLKPSQASRVTSIGTTFRNNTTITSFDELEYFTGLTSLASYCFAGCTSLESITIPQAVTAISSYAFDGDSSLATFTLKGVISSNSNYAFRGTSSLYSVNIPSLRDWLLCNFQGNNLYYPGAASKIHLYSEETGSEITSVTIPSDIASIRARCFFNCEDIGGSLVIPNTVTSIGRDFIAGTSISSVTIPGSVTSLPDQFFATSCPSLRTIIIEEGVETIGSYFLNNTNTWTYIDFPSTLTSISQAAFGRSGTNPVIICRSTTPPSLGVNPWVGTNSGLKIYVPYSSNHSILDAYKAASNWSAKASGMYELNSDGTVPA